MRTWTLVGPLLTAGLGMAAAAGIGHAQQRQLGAHEHGRGTLNIAIEGTSLTMELEAPGADIVGFEHKASTDQQKAAIETAIRRLKAADGLFHLPAGAGCTLKTSSAAIEAEDHDHHDGHDHDHGAEGAHHDDEAGHDKAGHAEGEHEHSGFRAEYAFECKSPAALTGIAFEYFNAFAGAQKLDVTVIGPKGQNRYEVTRAQPRIDLGGMM